VKRNMPDTGHHSTRIGVCGFCEPQAKLFREFQCLEVQQTFYWPPQLKTVERWRRTAPSEFVFTLKAFQAITHAYNSRTYRKARFSPDELAQCGGFGDTPVVRAAWELTRSLAIALDAPMVVFQCPPSLAATNETIQQMRSFFHWVSRGGLGFAWEPRHVSWTRDLIVDLCQELDLVHAVDPFEQANVFGLPRYYRLHGKSLGGYRYDYDHPYSDSELEQLRQWCAEQSNYCMFNNKQMAVDAGRFEQLSASSRSLPSTL
jgi:uncharacterized protein YecE (DUF72 family)